MAKAALAGAGGRLSGCYLFVYRVSPQRSVRVPAPRPPELPSGPRRTGTRPLPLGNLGARPPRGRRRLEGGGGAPGGPASAPPLGLSSALDFLPPGCSG